MKIFGIHLKKVNILYVQCKKDHYKTLEELCSWHILCNRYKIAMQKNSHVEKNGKKFSRYNVKTTSTSLYYKENTYKNIGIKG